MRHKISNIILTASLLAVCTDAMAQKPVLRGSVVDQDGKPVVGALVSVTETNRLAVTDKHGEFLLRNARQGDELCIDAEGYYRKIEMAKGDVPVFTVVRDSDIYAATAPLPFTEKKKKHMTEAVSVVTGEELEKHPVTVLQNAFNSTVTGVQTFESNSEPGWSETSMYIRGMRTMNGNAQHPLIIVDNVERDLSFLDAYPIESVTVLKDAAAAAIYGMKGANGAIIATTKRGEAGKTKINFTQEVGFQSVAGYPEQQNAYNYALSYNQALYLDGKAPYYSDYDIEQYRKLVNGEQLTGMDQYKYFNTNWAKVGLRSYAPQYRTNLQISGGSDRVKYYVSFSYLRQEGLYNTDWTNYNNENDTQHVLNRFNLRANVDVNINKFLTLNVDLGGRIDNIIQPTATWGGAGDAADAWQIFCFGINENKPTNPVFCPNGEFFIPTDNHSKNVAYMISSNGTEQNRRRNLYSTVNLVGDFGFLTKGLKGHITYSFDGYETFQKYQDREANGFYYDYMKDYTSLEEISYTRQRTYSALSTAITVPRDYYYNINMNMGFDYARQFGKHYTQGNAFFRTYQHNIRGQYSSYRYASFNFSGTYAYDDRYLFTANLSRMGSDNYSLGNRWDTFYGFSAGWNINKEPWFKKQNWKVDLLKIRASYGRAGYDIVNSGSSSQDGTTNRYPFQSEYSQGASYSFGRVSGASQSNVVPTYYESKMGSEAITWEISKMFNFGIDWDVWNHKFYGSFDVFKEWRSDILISPSSTPILLGITPPQESLGKAETHGIELTIGHSHRYGDFKWSIEGMLTWNKNKITYMDEVERTYDYQQRTGKRIGQGFALKFQQWASDENLIATSQQDAIDHPEKYPYNTFAGASFKLGNAVFQDTNGDRQIDVDDKIAMGYNVDFDRIPELTPSVKLGFEWKGFDARVIMTAYLNRIALCRENVDHSFGWGGATTHEIVNSWGYYTDDPADPRNINAKYPRLSAASFSSADRNDDTRESDIWWMNGDYLSLRNIEIGYSFPLRWISRLGMTKLRVYFSGYNLYNWSHLGDGFDPENPTNYIWTYPKTKSFTFGLNISF